MPYKDPEAQKVANRQIQRRKRAKAKAEMVDKAERERGAKRILPDPPDRDELLRLLGVQARSGSVRAIELLLKLTTEEDSDRNDGTTDPLSGVDELAARRSA